MVVPVSFVVQFLDPVLIVFSLILGGTCSGIHIIYHRGRESETIRQTEHLSCHDSPHFRPVSERISA
jgi:hypothetical protein